MTFYKDDDWYIAYVNQTGYYVLFLNAKPVRDAKNKKTLVDFVAKNRVDWDRPTTKAERRFTNTLNNKLFKELRTAQAERIAELKEKLGTELI